MDQQLELFNKYNPDFWTAKHYPCSTHMGVQTAELSLRSEELTHCMLNFYTKRYHDQQEELNQWKRQHKNIEQRAARLYQTVTEQQTTLEHFQFRIHQINEENASLFQTSMMMLNELPEYQIPTFRSMIASAINTPNYEVIDLTTDEELDE